MRVLRVRVPSCAARCGAQQEEAVALALPATRAMTSLAHWAQQDQQVESVPMVLQVAHSGRILQNSMRRVGTKETRNVFVQAIVCVGITSATNHCSAAGRLLGDARQSAAVVFARSPGRLQATQAAARVPINGSTRARCGGRGCWRCRP